MLLNILSNYMLGLIGLSVAVVATILYIIFRRIRLKVARHVDYIEMGVPYVSLLPIVGSRRMLTPILLSLIVGLILGTGLLLSKLVFVQLFLGSPVLIAISAIILFILISSMYRGGVSRIFSRTFLLNIVEDRVADHYIPINPTGSADDFMDIGKILSNIKVENIPDLVMINFPKNSMWWNVVQYILDIYHDPTLILGLFLADHTLEDVVSERVFLESLLSRRNFLLIYGDLSRIFPSNSFSIEIVRNLVLLLRNIVLYYENSGLTGNDVYRYDPSFWREGVGKLWIPCFPANLGLFEEEPEKVVIDLVENFVWGDVNLKFMEDVYVFTIIPTDFKESEALEYVETVKATLEGIFSSKNIRTNFIVKVLRFKSNFPVISIFLTGDIYLLKNIQFNGINVRRREGVRIVV